MSSETPSSSTPKTQDSPGISEALATPSITDRLEAFVRGQVPAEFEPVDEAASAFVAALCAHSLGARWQALGHTSKSEGAGADLCRAWKYGTSVQCGFLSSPRENPPSHTRPWLSVTRFYIFSQKILTATAPTAVVLSPESLENSCPTAETLGTSAIKIHPGDILDPGKLEKELREHGYEKTVQVHSPGQFAMRGGILDVFPWHGLAPLRLEFFDTELESLREFDIHSQVSTRRIKEAELTLGEISADGIIADFIQDHDRLLSIGGEAAELTHGTVSHGDDAAAEPLCQGSPLGSFEAGDFILNEARRHRFFQQIADWRSHDWRIYLTFSNKGEVERFKELVDENFFQSGSIEAIHGELVQGFTMPRAKLAFLSSSEIFGRYQTAQTRRKSTAMDAQRRARAQTALEEIDEGDLVVHAEYGIGRFQGIEHDEEGQEEIHILFQDGAILSVPLDHSHLLSKYVGLGGKGSRTYQAGHGVLEKGTQFGGKIHSRLRRQTAPDAGRAADNIRLRPPARFTLDVGI